MRTKAIIIKKVSANEHDQLVTCFSEDFGTMRALARGIYRPKSVQAHHLAELNLVEFEVVPGRSMPIIASAHVIEPFSNLRGDLPRLAAAQFFTEVLDKIAFENEKDEELWNFLNTMLVDMNMTPKEELISRFRQHQAEFLRVLGYAPQADRCVVCSKDALAGPEKMVALSTELGGVMCADCFLAGGRGVMFDKQDLGVLTGAAAGTTAAHSALDTFFEYTVGRKISSLSFLRSVLS